jgi:hypothetical protein
MLTGLLAFGGVSVLPRPLAGIFEASIADTGIG